MIAMQCHECDTVEYDELDGQSLFWPPKGWQEVEPVDEGSGPDGWPDDWVWWWGWCPSCIESGYHE